MKKIEIYVTDFCPYCRAAESLLHNKGLEFTAINVSEPDQKAALKAKTGWQTVPQIFIDGQLIGGYQELVKLNQAGKL